MTAAHRNLARLPLEIFENLIIGHHHQPHQQQQHGLDDEKDERDWKHPAELRDTICKRLVMMTLQQQQQQNQPRPSYETNTAANQTNDSVIVSANAPITAVATVGALLQTSTSTLLRVLDPLLTYEECEELRYRICLHCAAVPSSALGLLQRIHNATTPSSSSAMISSKLSLPYMDTSSSSQNMDHAMILSTGIPTLDDQLQGGIRVGTITELVGRAGVGKSQLALQLCVVAAMRYGQGSVYIDTEHKFQLLRLQQIAQQRQSTPTPPNNTTTSSSTTGWQATTANHVMANVTVHTPTTMNDVRTTVASLEEEILFRNAQATEEHCRPASSKRGVTPSSRLLPVRLVVLDSIAAPAKRDLAGNSSEQPPPSHSSSSSSSSATAAHGVAAMLQCAQMLKRLACQLDLAVVVINQASVAFQSSNNNNNNSTTRATANSAATNPLIPPVRAALGTAWHHCVSTRLLLDHTALEREGNNNDDETNSTNVISSRTLSVVKSNLVGFSQIRYQVTDGGLVETATTQN